MPNKLLSLLLAFPLLLSSCSLRVPSSLADITNPFSKLVSGETQFVNPHPVGTYENFKADPNYKKTENVYRNHTALSAMTSDSVALRINLSTQRAQLLHNKEVAIDYPVATGKSSHPTPPGNYEILEKIKDKRSNLYGQILDANGGVVKSNADSKVDEIPPGGSFLGAKLGYWMRFTWTGIGHHIGHVPRYPASHGCIRGKASIMPEIYSKVKTGTPVSIVTNETPLASIQ